MLQADSGCLDILAGLDRPTSGTVLVDGTEITHLDDADLTKLRRDKLGFIFQFFNLIPVLTAEENIELPLSIAGKKVDEEWLHRLVETILDISNIEQGELNLHLERLDLWSVVHNALERLRASTRPGLAFDLQPGPEPCWIMGDRLRLEQVFGHLLFGPAQNERI